MKRRIASVYVQIIPSMDNFFKEFSAETDAQMPKEGDKAAKSFGSGFKKAFKVLGIGALIVGGLAAGIASAGASKIIKGGLNRALSIEEAQASLKGLGYEAAQIGEITESVTAAVRGTAYGLDEAMTVSATALASGVKKGEALTNYMKLIADTSTITKSSLGEIGPIFNKIQAAGKASTQDLNQLANRGLPVFQWLQEELGVTSDELRKMVSNGEIDMEIFSKAIEKNIGGAALASGETTQGALANLGAAFNRLGAEIVSGGLPIAQQIFSDLTPVIDKVTEKIKPLMDQFWETFGPKVLNAVEKFSTVILEMLDGTYKGSGKLSGVIDIFKMLFEHLTRYSEIFEKIIPIVFEFFGIIADALKPILEELFEILKPIVDEALESFSEITKMLIPIVMELVEIIAPFIEQLLPVLLELFMSLVPVILNVVEALLPLIEQLLPPLLELVELLIPPLLEIVEAILPVFNALIEIVLALITPLIPVIVKLVEAFVKLLEPILMLIEPLLDLITTVLPPLTDWLGIVGEMIGGALSNALDVVIPLVQLLVENISNSLIPVIETIKDVMAGWIDFLVGVFTGDWERAWEGIQSIFEGIVSGLANFFINGINNMLRGLNWLIDGLNKILGAAGFIELFGFQAPQIGHISLIPKLAKGADIMPKVGGTLAILGEGGQAETVTNLGGTNQLIENSNKLMNMVLKGNIGSENRRPINIENITVQKPEYQSMEEFTEEFFEFLEFHGTAQNF